MGLESPDKIHPPLRQKILRTKCPNFWTIIFEGSSDSLETDQEFILPKQLTLSCYTNKMSPVMNWSAR